MKDQGRGRFVNHPVRQRALTDRLVYRLRGFEVRPDPPGLGASGWGPALLRQKRHH
jgi:hypothetical protein